MQKRQVVAGHLQKIPLFAGVNTKMLAQAGGAYAEQAAARLTAREVLI